MVERPLPSAAGFLPRLSQIHLMQGRAFWLLLSRPFPFYPPFPFCGMHSEGHASAGGSTRRS